MKLKHVFQFLGIWILTILVTLIFILPWTDAYQDASAHFDRLVDEGKIILPEQEAPFRYGFTLAYVLVRDLTLFFTILLTPIAVSILLVLLIHLRTRPKPGNLILTDPLNSLKNVGSNILLFTLGLFNRRASEPLQYYFSMPVKSRLIAVTAYALIFFSINLTYDYSNLPFGHWHIILYYSGAILPVLLIMLTLFFKPFRKNYQKRLLWISIAGLIFIWTFSAQAGFLLAIDKQNTGRSADPGIFFPDGKTMLINFFIVLAFSFYLEVMKHVFMQKTDMESEIRVARHIQTELLPELTMHNPKFDLYGRTVSANEVGGDYCDAIVLPDNRLALAVGDVSGHNVAAGVLMGMLKMGFRTALENVNSPENLVGLLNRKIYENKNKNMFISFLFTLIDFEHRKLSMINAGHPPLVRYSSKDDKIHEYRTGDMALGLRKNTEFVSKDIAVAEGDIFILLSDGLIETSNNEGTELGMAGINGILLENKDANSREIYNRFLRYATEFRGKALQRDDLTLTILKLLA